MEKALTFFSIMIIFLLYWLSTTLSRIKELESKDTKVVESRLEQRILDLENRYSALENRVFKLECRK